VGANNPDARFPEWRPGAWWQIRVRQRAMAARVPDPGWTLPWHMLFEVMAEEAVEDIPCYHIRVTYPDRPSRAEHKSADVWVSKDTRVPVRGSLHIADRTIPMRHDFLMQVLKTAPMEVDTAGIPRTLPDPRWPQERVQLEAFETRTPDGGTRLSSMAAPFPLRIDEPDYIVELQDWSD